MLPIAIAVIAFVAALFIVRQISMSTSTPVVSPQKESVTMIDLLNTGAKPAEVAIVVGTHVQFNSKDGQWHDIGEGMGKDEEHLHDHVVGGVESGVFGPDEAYRIQIKKPGVFYFHDHDNPNVSVMIISYYPENSSK